MSTDHNPVFQIQNLVVRYGRSTAVDGFSLQLHRGEALGLLGANGAGKTSTLRSLMGMLVPHSGAVAVFGGKPGMTSGLARTGFAPEEALPPERFSGREYLTFIARLRQKDPNKREEEINTLLEELDLAPHKRISDYSKGMKRRLVLAQAFVGNPELLVLDEPLNGLDPLIIVKLRARLEKYRLAGGSLLYSSHILAEVEKTCTRIVILKRGKQVLDLATKDTIEKYGSVENAFGATAGGEN